MEKDEKEEVEEMEKDEKEIKLEREIRKRMNFNFCSFFRLFVNMNVQ